LGEPPANTQQAAYWRPSRCPLQPRLRPSGVRRRVRFHRSRARPLPSVVFGALVAQKKCTFAAKNRTFWYFCFVLQLKSSFFQVFFKIFSQKLADSKSRRIFALLIQ
jgi:hypothetical protein